MHHDRSYKKLFADPQMMRDLLEAFVPGEWIAAADFDTLEDVRSEYITDDLRARAGDVVWRIRCGDHIVYLLLEFHREQIGSWPCAYLRTRGCCISV